MLQCKKCGKNILIDLSKYYTIRGIPVISEGNIKVSSVIFSCGDSSLSLSCPHCGEVKEEDLRYLCRECGQYFDKKDILVSSYGSSICLDCSKKYEVKGTKPFEGKIVVE